MKSKLVLFITGYIVSLGILIFLTYTYITNKEESSFFDVKKQISDIFAGTQYLVDTYSYNAATYSKCENPGLDKMQIEKQINREFPTLQSNSAFKSYGDIYKSYRIDNGGWVLSVAEFDGWRLMIYYISPVYVCYRKQTDSYLYEYMPYVETALDEAYKFWISNEKSHYSEGYRKGSNRDIANLPYTNNRYYRIEESGTGGWSDYNYMQNGYYRVFSNCSKITYYEIKKIDSAVKNDWIVILGVGFILLSTLFFLISRKDFKIYIGKKREKQKEETYSLLDELKEKCNPINFMEPYCKDKVDKANELYPKIINCSLRDIQLQRELRKEAVADLGVVFFSNKLLNELKDKCNPQRYMNPYDPIKVSIANSLYERILSNESNIEELEAIESEITERLL